MALSVVCHNVANLYAEPDDRSECVSQLIMNDPVLVIEQEAEFVLVEGRDGYQGWVREQHIVTAETEIAPTNSQIIERSVGVHSSLSKQNDTYTRLVLGTRIFARTVRERVGVRIPQRTGEKTGYIREVETVLTDAERANPKASAWENRAGKRDLINVAVDLCVGVPYLWGGTTTFGFDCSGLTQRLYGLWEIVLPRDAYLQYESPLGAKLSMGQPYQPGDLVFFVGKTDPRQRGITHVGMMIDEKQVVHAYSKMGVIVTPLSEMTTKLGYTYRGAWRYCNEADNEE